MKKAYLLLCDGTLFEGESLGAEGVSIGEVVFNTSMTGYQEVLTDPSYYGQIVCMTYPLIGNYGINETDFVSDRIWLKGFIVRHACETPSNWRSKCTLDKFLKDNSVVGISGIDTRKLTRIIRNHGVMNGAIFTEGHVKDKEGLMEKIKGFQVKGGVMKTTGSEKEELKSGCKKYKIALLDLGSKKNIARSLAEYGCDVTMFPADTKAREIEDGGFDGIMLSNGPGDPADNKEIIKNIGVLMNSGIPMFGICLGHQLMALAMGGKTEKLKYGHRGANHPVNDIELNRTYITRQNHGYTVVPGSIPDSAAYISHVNLNDKTVEGISYKNIPAFSVQYHPEYCPGPLDSSYLFDRFLKLVEDNRRKS